MQKLAIWHSHEIYEEAIYTVLKSCQQVMYMHMYMYMYIM